MGQRNQAIRITRHNLVFVRVSSPRPQHLHAHPHTHTRALRNRVPRAHAVWEYIACVFDMSVNRWPFGHQPFSTYQNARNDHR